MKNLKLKLTMIVTIIAIIMMNAVVFAATNMTTNVTTNNEGKKIVDVTVTIQEENLWEASFELEYVSDSYKYITSNAENLVEKNGKLKVGVDNNFLKAHGNAVTFTFEYTGEEKTNTCAFKVLNTKLVDGDENMTNLPTFSENVTIKFENTTTEPSPEPSTEPSIEPSAEPSKEPSQTETAKPSETTNPNPSTNEGTKGEVGLNDKKPTKIPQAGTNVVPYIVGGVAILMVAGLIIINNKKINK